MFSADFSADFTENFTEALMAINFTTDFTAHFTSFLDDFTKFLEHYVFGYKVTSCHEPESDRGRRTVRQMQIDG